MVKKSSKRTLRPIPLRRDHNNDLVSRISDKYLIEGEPILVAGYKGRDYGEWLLRSAPSRATHYALSKNKAIITYFSLRKE